MRSITIFKSILTLASLIFLLGCYEMEDTKLETALKLSGNNRQELERVLDHYGIRAEDSLKYRAARFLIENMVWHSGQVAGSYQSLWALFLKEDSLVRLNNFSSKRQKNQIITADLKKLIPHWAYASNVQNDISHLNASFLIDNIEAAFQVWDLEWCRHLNFEVFCEFILPYRFAREPVFGLRNELHKHFSQILQEHIKESDPASAIKALNEYIIEQGLAWDIKNRPPDLGFFNIIWPLSASFNCMHHVSLVGQLARVAGIPMSSVFIPAWRDSQIGHEMCAMPNNLGQFNLFTAIFQQPGEFSVPHNPNRATKIYRRTYASQPETPFFLKREKEELPPGFSSPCLIDITQNYTSTTNLELQLNSGFEEVNLVWLTVFINGGWRAIGWGRVNHKKRTALFENVPIGITGVASVYRDNALQPITDMVKITEMGPEKIKPSNETIQLLLTRKFPEKAVLYDFVMANLGAVIEGAYNADFKNAVKLAVVNDTLKPFLQDIIINSPSGFRYYRIKTATWGLELAEVEFITSKEQHGVTLATPLPIMHPDSLPDRAMFKFNGLPFSEKDCLAAFDGEMLTYSSQKWIGMDMGRPVKVERVRLAPRNAHNGIVPGNRYQLLYWNNSWVPLDQKVARYNYLQFENVPSNTVYWLRNLDHGREEQPFFFKDGRQVFVNLN
jgi:hypothetical protein